MNASPTALAAMAAFTNRELVHAHGQPSILEPWAGNVIAERFLGAMTDGTAEPEDAWRLVSEHLERRSPHEAPRLHAFIVALATAAATGV